MRKVIGITKLADYLDSVNFPLSSEAIHELILNKNIPHRMPLNNMIVFNLEHIDSWIEQQRQNPK